MGDNTTLGAFIARKRQELKLSLRAMATAADIDDSVLSKIERGLVKQPTSETLDRLAPVVGVDPEDLYALAGYTAAGRLPTYAPYLRSKYGLPTQAVDELTTYFDFVRQKYGDGEPLTGPTATVDQETSDSGTPSPHDDEPGDWDVTTPRLSEHSETDQEQQPEP